MTDPRFVPEHATYYPSGLLDHTAARNLLLALDGFPVSYTDSKPLAFTFRGDGVEHNSYIAADGMPELDPALAWVDVYGKVILLPRRPPGMGVDRRGRGPLTAARV